MVWYAWPWTLVFEDPLQNISGKHIVITDTHSDSHRDTHSDSHRDTHSDSHSDTHSVTHSNTHSDTTEMPTGGELLIILS
jgi:hypothetical protein